MKTRNGHHEGTRYDFDFDVCTAKYGWAQVDTWQDAPYFGVWVNPVRWAIFTFAEGDTIAQEFQFPGEFTEEIRRLLTVYSEPDQPAKIDGMCNEQIVSAFKVLGLEDCLH